MRTIQFREALREALSEEMRRDERVFLMGEEVAEYNSIMTDIQTYVDEYKLKFILGTESLDNFPQFVENIKNMGIERAIEIRQAEYDRYLER